MAPHRTLHCPADLANDYAVPLYAHAVLVPESANGPRGIFIPLSAADYARWEQRLRAAGALPLLVPTQAA